MCIFQVSLLFFIVRHSQAVEIAREVDGGVELLSPGEIELILPEVLSFTVKSPGSFIGKAEFCYAALTTTNRIKAYGYHNCYVGCPEGTCDLLISDEHRAHGLNAERRGSVINYEFKDFNDDTWCPRLLVVNRQNFTILRLPEVPVIVNGASLPKHENETAANATISIKWVVIICVVVLLLILVVVIGGVFIYIKLKKKPASVKNAQQSFKSRKSHCKTSPAVVSSVPSTHQQSKRDLQVNSSNSANNIEDV